MDDIELDALLDRSAPKVADRDAALLEAIDDLVDATGTPVPRLHRRPRMAVAGLVVAGTLGIGGVAAAGGWLPALSWSPWADQEFASGQSCHLRFMAVEQSEPRRVEGVSRTEQRAAIVAAQTWLDAFDVGSIDMQQALSELRAAQAKVNENVPEWDRASETQQELEVHALVYETGVRLRAALREQGFDPDAADIVTTHDCQDQP